MSMNMNNSTNRTNIMAQKLTSKIETVPDYIGDSYLSVKFTSHKSYHIIPDAGQQIFSALLPSIYIFITIFYFVALCVIAAMHKRETKLKNLNSRGILLFCILQLIGYAVQSVVFFIDMKTFYDTTYLRALQSIHELFCRVALIWILVMIMSQIIENSSDTKGKPSRYGFMSSLWQLIAFCIIFVAILIIYCVGISFYSKVTHHFAITGNFTISLILMLLMLIFAALLNLIGRLRINEKKDPLMHTRVTSILCATIALSIVHLIMFGGFLLSAKRVSPPKQVSLYFILQSIVYVFYGLHAILVLIFLVAYNRRLRKSLWSTWKCKKPKEERKRSKDKSSYGST